MDALTQTQKDAIKDIAMRFGAMDVRLFGSRERGTEHPGSDVDLLVRFGREATLLTVIGFQQAVQEATGADVDVVEEGSLSPTMAKRILIEAIPL